MFVRRRLRVGVAAAVVAVGLVIALVAGRHGSHASAASVDAYKGLGAWIDIYDDAAWSDPAGTVDALHSRKVQTLFLETSNYKSGADLADPEAVASFLDSAHKDGMKVVAWTLPALDRIGIDLRRALAAVHYESPEGQSFDGFALDMEPGRVSDASLLTAGAVRLSREIRGAVGSDYALGAIIPSPVALARSSSLWAGFPYERLASYYDIFVPMDYYTYQTDGPEGASSYTGRALDLLHGALGTDVVAHAVGGLAQDSDAAEVKAFVRAAKAHGAVGYSLYDDATTTGAEYAAFGG